MQTFAAWAEANRNDSRVIKLARMDTFNSKFGATLGRLMRETEAERALVTA